MKLDKSHTTNADERRQPAEWVLLAVVILIILPTAFMGAYYSMLDGHTMPTFGGTTRPVYRFNPPIVQTIFFPAHWLDRRVRPERWESPDFPPVYL